LTGGKKREKSSLKVERKKKPSEIEIDRLKVIKGKKER